MEKQKQYIVGEQTRAYLDALDALTTFRGKFLDALTNAYGEQSGMKMYHEHDEQLDAVTLTVMDYMRYSMTEEMGTDKGVITI